MKYLEKDDHKENNNENIVTVYTILNMEYFRFSFENSDRIYDLKREIGEIMNCNIQEQSIIIGENYPYPLSDDLKISDLLENHRLLTVVISENPKKVVPTRLIIKRNISYVDDTVVPSFKVLNLRNIYDSDIEHIDLWIDEMNYRLIEIDYNNVYFPSIMESINNVLEYSLDYKPCLIRSLIIYNRNILNLQELNEKLINDFTDKIKSYNCYKRTKVIYK